MALSPGQKKALMYGVPIVAVLALFAYLRSKGSSPSSAGAATGTVATSSNSPIGLDQLASAENAIQSEFGNIGQTLTSLQNQVNGLAATPSSGSTQVAPPPNKTPPIVGFGSTVIGGTSYTELGVLSGGLASSYIGYDVKAGVPVYYLAPGQSTPKQGSSEVTQGAEILVPSAYNPYVSPTASHKA